MDAAHAADLRLRHQGVSHLHAASDPASGASTRHPRGAWPTSPEEERLLRRLPARAHGRDVESVQASFGTAANGRQTWCRTLPVSAVVLLSAVEPPAYRALRRGT